MHARYLGDSNTGIDPAFGGMRKEEGVLSLRHRNEPNTYPSNHPHKPSPDLRWGARDVHPDVWQTGWVNLRTGAGAACGAHNCSLGRFEINCLWDKDQFDVRLF